MLLGINTNLYTDQGIKCLGMMNPVGSFSIYKEPFILIRKNVRDECRSLLFDGCVFTLGLDCFVTVDFDGKLKSQKVSELEPTWKLSMRCGKSLDILGAKSNTMALYSVEKDALILSSGEYFLDVYDRPKY